MIDHKVDLRKFIDKQPATDANMIVFDRERVKKSSIKMSNISSEYSMGPGIPFCATIICTNKASEKSNLKYVVINGNNNIVLNFATFSKDAEYQGLTADNVIHSHNYYEMMYVYSGDIPVAFEDQTVVCHQGEVCILDTKTKHIEFYSDDNIVFYFCMSKEYVNRILQSYQMNESTIGDFLSKILKRDENHSYKSYLHLKPKSVASGFGEKINLTIEQMIQELLNFDTGGGYIVQGLLIRLMSMFSDRGLYNSIDNIIKLEWNSQLFERISAYLEERCGNVSRHEISEHLHYNSDYINRVIKRYTGLSFSQYCNAIRLKNVEKLLVASGLSINRIIDDLDFKNKTYFYKIFTNRYGITPAQYRMDKMHASVSE